MMSADDVEVDSAHKSIPTVLYPGFNADDDYVPYVVCSFSNGGALL